MVRWAGNLIGPTLNWKFLLGLSRRSGSIWNSIARKHAKYVLRQRRLSNFQTSFAKNARVCAM